MTRNFREWSVLAGLAIVSTGCVHDVSKDVRRECREISQEFLSGKSIADRLEAFEESNADLQYRIYFCGMRLIHPRPTYLLESYWDRGSDAVRVLKSHLANARDDQEVHDISWVIWGMYVGGSTELGPDEELEGLLELRIGGMPPGELRDHARMLYDQIGFGSQETPTSRATEQGRVHPGPTLDSN